MAIYQLDLDLLETARDGFQESAEKLNMDIETLYGTVAKTSEDIYSGVDADAFRNGLTDYTKTRFTELWEQTERFGKALTDGLENGKRCKKICNDFTLTLDGTSNGKAWEDMRGMLYCDQDTIMWLQQICRLAMSEANSIRESASAIDDILSGLQMTHFDSTQYTDVIREGCNKVDRLQQHSSDLTTYASAVEASDESLRLGVDDFTFMTPEEARLLPADPQTKAITAIMNKPVSELTKEDKDIIDKNLRILTQNNEIIELETLARQMGNRPDGVWTAGDIYVAARIIDYSETKCDAMVASAVYNRMKKVTQIEAKSDVHTNSVYTAYTYEVSLDSEITGRILKELDPVMDGLAYYSLQRRRNYTESIEKTVYGLSSKEPDIDFDISFKKADGKLISVFETEGKTVELSSVNMNKIVGAEGTSCLSNLGFSESEMTALMSCIYTDDDITFIGDLAKANTETDYREVFQNNPDNLSPYTKLGLYNYSLALLDKNVTYDDKMKITEQNFEQLENFINGMLYRKSESSMYDDFEAGNRNAFKIDYRPQYLQAMITAGEIQMDTTRSQMKSNYENSAFIRGILPVFAENTQMLSLYSTLECRLSEYPGYSLENYIQISGLGLDNNPQENVLGNDMNCIMFSYCEEVMYDDQPSVYRANGTEKPIINEIEIMKSLGKDIAVDYINDDYVKKAKEAKYAFPKAVLEQCVAIILAFNPEIGTVTEGVDLINRGISVSEAHSEANETGEKIYSMLGGTQISYKEKDGFAFEDPVPVMGGQYDANAFLKMTWLENKGLKEFPDVDTSSMEESTDIIVNQINDTNNSSTIDKRTLYEQYLLIQGKSYENGKEHSFHAQALDDITPDNIVDAIDNLEDLCADGLRGLNYLDYNIIDKYYFGSKNENNN